jgi:hypothetical protein
MILKGFGRHRCRHAQARANLKDRPAEDARAPSQPYPIGSLTETRMGELKRRRKIDTLGLARF